jgi:hypothetical protein
MTFDLHIQIDDQSPEAIALETIASRESVSLEDAVKRLLKAFAVQSDPDNYDHIFTPQLIAKLDAARAEARTGKNQTMEQVKENLKIRRQAWLVNHPA